MILYISTHILVCFEILYTAWLHSVLHIYLEDMNKNKQELLPHNPGPVLACVKLILPSSALVLISFGLRWSLILIYPNYPPTHQLAREVSKRPNITKHRKVKLIRLVSRPQITKIMNSAWWIFITVIFMMVLISIILTYIQILFIY